MENMIEITGCSLTKLVKEAYALSQPQGLGFIHYTEGDLPDEDVKQILSRNKSDARIAINMDYVKGRAVKLTVFREDGKLFIPKNWYDHTSSQLDELLKKLDLQKVDLELQH